MSLWRVLSMLILGLALNGCASLQRNDPLQVTVAGIEPLPGQGLELRMLVKLRVQNPNDAALDYDGVFVEMDVKGKTFASGVSDAVGSVPRFGESVIEVPVTASAFRIVRQVVGFAGDDGNGKIDYVLKGKLNSSAFRSLRFESRGQLQLPASGPAEGT
ncbi:MAG TPA: LEA type 2 family protein [Povalibacter sp.]|nr:LEA type 2 family protein [Povalibacter sp.]